MEPTAPALQLWSLNHWTTREVPIRIFKYIFWIQFYWVEKKYLVFKTWVVGHTISHLKKKRGGFILRLHRPVILLISDLKHIRLHVTHHFFSQPRNELLWWDPAAFFFCVAMLWKRSARHVNKFSFFFCWALCASTFSTETAGRKYRAWRRSYSSMCFKDCQRTRGRFKSGFSAAARRGRGRPGVNWPRSPVSRAACVVDQ